MYETSVKIDCVNKWQTQNAASYCFQPIVRCGVIHIQRSICSSGKSFHMCVRNEQINVKNSVGAFAKFGGFSLWQMGEHKNHECASMIRECSICINVLSAVQICFVYHEHFFSIDIVTFDCSRSIPAQSVSFCRIRFSDGRFIAFSCVVANIQLCCFVRPLLIQVPYLIL